MNDRFIFCLCQKHFCLTDLEIFESARKIASPAENNVFPLVAACYIEKEMSQKQREYASYNATRFLSSLNSYRISLILTLEHNNEVIEAVAFCHSL